MRLLDDGEFITVVWWTLDSSRKVSAFCLIEDQIVTLTATYRDYLSECLNILRFFHCKLFTCSDSMRTFIADVSCHQSALLISRSLCLSSFRCSCSHCCRKLIRWRWRDWWKRFQAGECVRWDIEDPEWSRNVANIWYVAINHRRSRFFFKYTGHCSMSRARTTTSDREFANSLRIHNAYKHAWLHLYHIAGFPIADSLDSLEKRLRENLSHDKFAGRDRALHCGTNDIKFLAMQWKSCRARARRLIHRRACNNYTTMDSGMR